MNLLDNSGSWLGIVGVCLYHFGLIFIAKIYTNTLLMRSVNAITKNLMFINTLDFRAPTFGRLDSMLFATFPCSLVIFDIFLVVWMYPTQEIERNCCKRRVFRKLISLHICLIMYFEGETFIL